MCNWVSLVVDQIHSEIINYNLPANILKAFLPSAILPTCPAYLNLLDLITLTLLAQTVHTMKFLIVEPSHSTFSLHVGPNIRPRILFSNTLSLDYSLNARNLVITCSTQLSFLISIPPTKIGKRQKLLTCSLWSFLYYHFYPSNDRIAILFSNIYCLRSSFIVRDHVSCRTTVSNILVLKFLKRSREPTKVFSLAISETINYKYTLFK